MSRINDAVSRILAAKFDLGLFERPWTNRSQIDDIGSRAHRALARKAVQKSQVLLKNSHGTLPLRPGSKVYVAGSNADNIGNQAGGWTLTWQGGSTNVIPGQTILDGIEQRAGRVTFSQDASAPVPSGAAGIVVVGETPYAEGFGDVGGPLWAFDPGDNNVPRPEKTMRLSDADKAAVQKVCAEAASCTVVVVSGRPMVIEPALLAQIDALDAAWLPGSEGGGVADTLFGKAPFTGKLSFSWPRSLAQEPINVGDPGLRPALPLRLGARHPLSLLRPGPGRRTNGYPDQPFVRRPGLCRRSPGRNRRRGRCSTAGRRNTCSTPVVTSARRPAFTRSTQRTSEPGEHEPAPVESPATAVSGSADEVLDPNRLEELRQLGMGGSMLTQLMESFVTRAPALLAALGDSRRPRRRSRHRTRRP